MPKAPLTLSRFVECPENRAALVAIRRLADRFGASNGRGIADDEPLPLPFPTLYLHGPAGCGKSHLVEALAAEVTRQRRDAIIQVLAAGELAIHEQRTLFAADDEQAVSIDPSELEDAKHCDMLILEDVQHLKIGVVEALVQVIDYLVARRRPVVVTGNNGPRSLISRGGPLPARLSNRFCAGLVIALEPLGPRSRLAVLQALAQRQQLAVSTEILKWLAHCLTGGGRQIEGAVSKLGSLQKLSKADLDLATVQSHFAVQAEIGKPTIQRITERVGEYFRVDPDDLQSSRRQRGIVMSRQVSMYLAREMTGLTLDQIGAYFGGRDHSTVLHACRKVQDAITSDHMIGGAVRELQAGLA